MQFSPLLVSAVIIEPLRYFFSTYTDKYRLKWDEDEKKRTMEIDHSFNFHKIPLQEKPRILVSRGDYQVNKVGLTENLAEGKSFKETKGLKDYVNMLLYQGQAQMIIEARQKGTCELLADMATHFISWTVPQICDTQGFKSFALPMSVGDCQPTQDEDVEKFQIVVGLPWIKEEHWRVRDDGPVLKNILLNIHV